MAIPERQQHPCQDVFVGTWLVQTGLNCITRDGKTTRITPRAMQVLCSLVHEAPGVVSRSHLFETVWRDTLVVDDALTQTISELRKAFGDTPTSPSIIETIPKTGYRLIAPVSVARSEDTLPQGRYTIEVMPSLPMPAPSRRASVPVFFWSGVMVILLAMGFGIWWYVVGSEGAASAKPLQSFPLTTYPGFEIHPALSPSGTQVAFAWTGEDGKNLDIYVKLIGTETPLRLTNHPGPDQRPTWSPDGQHLAFMRYTQEGDCQVLLVPALGGSEKKVASCHGNAYADLAWSPDGQWMAFSKRDSTAQTYHIVLRTLNGEEERPLTHPPDGIWGDYDPSFSPDGRWLAFTRSLSEGNQDILVVPVEGGTEQPLTAENHTISGHHWTDDGNALIYSSDRDGTQDLWRIPITGGPAVNLLTSSLHLRAPFVALQGHRLVYEQWSYDTNLWRIRLSNTASTLLSPEQVITSTRWELHPSYSPDGDHIAFTSNRSGTFEIWVSDHEGAHPMSLTSFNGPFISTPRWSPDGTQLVFDARPEGHADLYVIDAQGGQPHRLTTAASDDLAASWSHDGRWIYFASNRSGDWQVWKIPTAGGTPIQVTRQGGFAASEAPDGHALYYTKKDHPGLWRQSASGETEQPILPFPAIDDWGNWVIQDEGIYFVHRKPDALWYYAFDTQETVVLFQPTRPIPRQDPALAVSPDGQWVLFGQVDRSESDLMLVENVW